MEGVLFLQCIEDIVVVFFFQAEDGIRDSSVTGVQTCALPILIDFAAPHRRSFLPRRSSRAALPREGSRSAAVPACFRAYVAIASRTPARFRRRRPARRASRATAVAG